MAKVETFYHQESSSLSYIVYDLVAGHAIIIDSVLDFSANSGQISSQFVDRQIEFMEKNQLTLVWILETHAHADHLSAAYYLKTKLNAKVAVGAGIQEVQQTFNTVFNYQQGKATTDIFDRLLQHNDQLSFGDLTCRIIATPGHTSDSITFLINDNAFVGDTLFMPDGGTARCDFPGGSSEQLFDSVQQLHQLPSATKLWMWHDYQPNDRALRYVTTVANSKANNIHLREGINKTEFVELRSKRDANLQVPTLLYASLQVNIHGGRLPVSEVNGQTYLKTPLQIANNLQQLRML
ncbi:MAG: MBL fold metallo-hydrolase [Psychrobium sp.]|nr:MBL fold metallo-hydrolase [Psychrobium sp.]